MRLTICFTIDSVTFTDAVISGRESLGGSESACLGLARALAARGHLVHIFTTKLGADAPERDHAGVCWHDMSRLAHWSYFISWDVAIALRQPMFLAHIPAKYRVLWCQDLMANEAMKNYVMSLAWSYDAVAYVSDYHRHQWEAIAPELAPIGWATKNGHDAALAQAARESATKRPNRIIHISRPERGLMPLLKMWPLLRAAYPTAELALCRYSSMYDPQGWGSVCQSFDDLVQQVNADVGGITYLGELGKPDLYAAIAEAAVMWYPGVSDFAETSCIAAVESQACGTPFVGSYKGALPETVPSGVLIPGVAEADPNYHESSVRAVVDALRGCASQSVRYRETVQAGLKHVEAYSYEVIAAEWERWLLGQFRARYEGNTAGVLRRMVHEDDYVMGTLVAADMGDAAYESFMADARPVLAGQVTTADDYATHALTTENELLQGGARLASVVKHMVGCQRVLDIACGNGAYAIALAEAEPTRSVVAVDYSAANIASGKALADARGCGDRIEWICESVWDFERHQPSAWFQQFAADQAGTFNGVWCGEFMEHVVNTTALVDTAEQCAAPMARMVWSCPAGPLHALATRTMGYQRTHVHHFRPVDLDHIFGLKNAYTRVAMTWVDGVVRGEACGNWLVSYRKEGPTGVRPFERRILQRPYQRLTVGMIVNSTLDLRRCLDPIWPVADEIVLGDCGCPAGELDQIVKEFPRKTRIVRVGDVASLPGGFSEARNRVLDAATGEWFFWIDADEMLCGPGDLGKYLDNTVFTGYIVPQNHLYLDGPMGTDIPVRIFQRRPDIRFYGCIHEQPQQGDCNTDIAPLLQLADVQIAHTGYLHESLRRDKALNRNLPLLIRDQQMFPDRLLGKLLVLRDHANLALWDIEQAQGGMTENAKAHYAQVVAIFEKYFSDPTHKFYPLAKPFYEQALTRVHGAMQLEIGLAGKVDGLGDTRAKPERVWVRTLPQAQAVLAHRVDTLLASLAPPKGMDVEPLRRAVALDPVDDVMGVPV